MRRQMVEVEVRRINREATVWDEEFTVPRSPVVYGAPEKVMALVKWDERIVPTLTGAEVLRTGYFSVSAGERDPEFQVGDMVVSIGGRQLTPPAYVTAVRPSARIGGRYRFIRYLFETRPQGVTR